MRPRRIDTIAAMARTLARLGIVLMGLVLFTGCDETPSRRPVLDAYFVVVRLALDPATRVAEVADGAEDARPIRDVLGLVDCASANLALIHVRQSADPDALAQVMLLVGFPEDDSDLCVDGGPVSIDDSSFIGGDRARGPVVGGPLLIEGRTLDGRLPLGRLAGLGLFPEWWQVSGRATGFAGFDAGVGDSEIETDFALEDTTATGTWRVGELHAARIADLPGGEPTDVQSMLDVMVAFDAQPDVDVDFDGRERFADSDADGRVDRCFEGDDRTRSRPVEGVECPLDPRFADGYRVRLRFRLVRVSPVNPLPPP